MHRTVDKVSHVVRRMGGERMLRETGSGGYIVRHLPRHLQLAVRPVCKHSDQNIFKRDQPDTQLHDFGVRKIRCI